MSAYLFAKTTSTRLAKPKDAKADASSSTFLTSVAALVPAEALAVQLAILQITTAPGAGSSTMSTSITHPGPLKVSFYFIAALSSLAYLAARITSKQDLRWLDLAGAVIAPAAFVAWSLLQSPSAFQAAFPRASQTDRETAGYLLTSFLLVVAPLFAYSVGKTEPKPK